MPGAGGATGARSAISKTASGDPAPTVLDGTVGLFANSRGRALRFKFPITQLVIEICRWSLQA
jgi:hypothetical protein